MAFDSSSTRDAAGLEPVDRQEKVKPISRASRPRTAGDDVGLLALDARSSSLDSGALVAPAKGDARRRRPGPSAPPLSFPPRARGAPSTKSVQDIHRCLHAPGSGEQVRRPIGRNPGLRMRIPFSYGVGRSAAGVRTATRIYGRSPRGRASPYRDEHRSPERRQGFEDQWLTTLNQVGIREVRGARSAACR